MPEIRRPRLDEAEAVFGLFRDTVRRVNSQDYTSEQIDIWLDSRQDEITAEQIQGGHWWAYVDDCGNLLGLGTLGDNQITGLYVHADHLGEGIGSAVLAHMEEQIQKDGSVFEILVESTMTAEPFYRSRGYEEVSKGRVGPARLEVVNMRKRLSFSTRSSVR